ncbi:MAG TPA: VOC family protein [Parafilimonas sp.]|nr:VOC family protein [Parafilimonas sp.]
MELSNALNWFEIPVSDFDRAKKFYETIFNYQMPENFMGSTRMGFFLYDFRAGKVGGAIVLNEQLLSPSENGSLIYLNAQPDLQIILDRIEAAGGTIIKAKTIISEEQNLGYWALMKDTEGNRVALHSMG